MKKQLCLGLAALLVLGLFAGCAKDAPLTADGTPAPVETATAAPAETAAPEATVAPSTLATMDEQTVTLPEVTPFLTLEEYPRVDGSTANLPLMAAVMASATGISYDEAANLVEASTTPYAYTRLLEGQVDLLLVYEGSGSTQKELEASPVKLNMAPIGRDALVMIVNEANPVQSLTQDQLRDIYTGRILNWKEVGGKDEKIVAFQRVESSGSQALFIKLLMGDVTPMVAPTELAPGGMGELIEDLAEYNNAGNALGYSVYYYASYMYTRPGLRFIGVDGVMPTDETIASGEYPLLNPFYAVTRVDEPADSPAAKLAAWLQTEEGKAVIAAAGYIPVP